LRKRNDLERALAKAVLADSEFGGRAGNFLEEEPGTGRPLPFPLKDDINRGSVRKFQASRELHERFDRIE
jgi:hypothetical protein